MDLKDNALKKLTISSKMFLQDLEALPEDAFAKKFSDKTRTVADLVYEVMLVNDHICMVMRNEKPFDWPEGDWITAPADFQSKEAVVKGFRASADKMAQTVEAMSNEDIEATVQTEHGERTRFDRCIFMALHMWYHSGQFNYIQTMLGDTAMHWD